MSIVIQKGTIKPSKNKSIQKAIPAINKKSTIPKTLIAPLKFEFQLSKLEKILFLTPLRAQI
jgi:hypothetical protein